MVTPVKVLKKWSLFEGDKVIWMILFFLGMISIIEVYSACLLYTSDAADE